jgi:AraC family transcriptional regulator
LATGMAKIPIKIIDSFPNPNAAKYDENLWYSQHDDSIVIINCESKNIYYPKHWTPLSVKCAFHGTEHYHFEKNSFCVSDKNFLILNEGSEYRSSIWSETPTNSFTINFTAQIIKEIFRGISHHAIGQLDDPFRNDDRSTGFVEKLYPHDGSLSHLLAIRNIVQRKEFDQAYLLELIYLTLGEMITLYNKTSAEIDELKAKKRSTREELYKRLYRAKDHIDSYYHADISLQKLSEISLMNSFYLLREFKNAFKITPHQYLTQRRLKKAMHLLITTKLHVDDVRDQVGFQDTSSFSKLFKKVYGSAPAIFRKRYINESSV